MRVVNVLVADDNAEIRRILREILERSPATVVREACDGLAAIQAVGDQLPDLVLLDVSMPRMNGFAATERLLARWPNLPIIIVTEHTENVYAETAFRLGVRGYVLKRRAESQLTIAMSRVMAGDLYPFR